MIVMEKWHQLRLKQLWEMTQFWRAKAKEQPNNYPFELPEEKWDEYLKAFCDMSQETIDAVIKPKPKLLATQTPSVQVSVPQKTSRTRPGLLEPTQDEILDKMARRRARPTI